MEVKMDITFAISSSIVLHAVLYSLFNFSFNSLRKAHNSQQAELAKVEILIDFVDNPKFSQFCLSLSAGATLA